MDIYIPSLGYGNIIRLSSFFSNYGVVSILTEPPILRTKADKAIIILPGVGSFAKVIEFYKKSGWESFILDSFQSRGIHIIGICLGMHLLGLGSTEGGLSEGMGILDGKVVALSTIASNSYPIDTNMGWHKLIEHKPVYANEFCKGDSYYFCHSYGYQMLDQSTVLSSVDLGYLIPSVIETYNITGLQFHPELSQMSGKNLISSLIKKKFNS